MIGGVSGGFELLSLLRYVGDFMVFTGISVLFCWFLTVVRILLVFTVRLSIKASLRTDTMFVLIFV